MAVYRSDQAQLTFATEAAQGGDPEQISGTFSGEPTAAIASGYNYEAGTRTIVVTLASAGSPFLVGDTIRIGTVAGVATASVDEHEARKIEDVSTVSTTSTILLDRPTAFYHATGQEVKGLTGIEGTVLDENKLITFIPGVYETVDTPDPEMAIEGRRFLGTQSKRAWSVAYPGQQTLTGSVSGIVLLNGWPLRFPVGKVTTIPYRADGGTQAIDGTAITLAGGGAKKGDIFITVSATHGLVVNDHVWISGAAHLTSTEALATCEVRKVQRVATANVMKLDSPLSFDHDSGDYIREVDSSLLDHYLHTIEETVELDTVSWHVHMRDSGETVANDFDRRYVGGMIGSSTISAEEGGLVTMSWDSVNFLDMVHNQSGSASHPQMGGRLYAGSQNLPNDVPRFGLMQSIDSTDIGIPGNGSDNTGYPRTEPYYFSNGEIKLFGVAVARMRSFSLSIANGEEPRYYIAKQGNRKRGPYEIREGAREYSMSCTLALPDSIGATDADSTRAGALEVFKQLLMEGHYGGTATTNARVGLTASMSFERGQIGGSAQSVDKLVIDIPGSTSAGATTTGAAKLNEQGMFITSAPHSLTTDNPYQIDIDAIFPHMKMYVYDSIPVYP